MRGWSPFPFPLNSPSYVVFREEKRLFIFRSHIYVEFITADIAALGLKIPSCYQGAAALTCYSGDFIVRLKYSSGKGESGNWFISNRN